MKKCSSCGESKPVTEFYKNSKRSDGLQSSCKQCMSVSYRSNREQNKERYQQVQEQRRIKNRDFIRKWKEEKGCACCDENFGPCLELHHPDPNTKEYNPAQLATFSVKRFLEEAEKCVVVCANCHRKIHHGLIESP